MFGGHDEPVQAAQDTAAQIAAPDAGLTAPANTVVAPTVGAPAMPGSYDDSDTAPAPDSSVVGGPAPAMAPPLTTPAAGADMPIGSDDLLEIKQQALQQLSPLVGHLEQTPEEKFRTTMMMIQAADNQSLIKEAYAAAQQIPDEKARAQALLDIVNEINYFTQHAGQPEQ